MDDEARRKLHAEYTAEIRKRQLSSSENFDKSVLTLSSGGLALSMGFLKDFISIADARFAWALYTSWVALTVATCCTIVSFLVSLRAHGVAQKAGDRYYIDGDEKAFDELNPWDICTNRLNVLSGASFVSGIVLTTLFVSTNLGEAAAMKISRSTNDGVPVPSMNKISVSGDVQRGAPVPQMTPISSPVQPAAGSTPSGSHTVAPSSGGQSTPVTKK